ncbi:MAG: class I SAM-dependent methyltransferase [Bacteroidales bacterium]|nr:class I SAM-dependent methyltransferase [Bacteroidales bacterium]
MSDTGHCLVCGSTDSSGLFAAKDHLVSGESFLLEKCNACGFVFTASPPDEDKMQEYYVSGEYISHSDTKSSLTDQAYHLARNFMLRKKHNLLLELNGGKPGNLLDIGSGTGYFAGYMKNRNWNVTGIEISDRAREYSISRFGISVLDPDSISAVEDGYADCITLWHVLEHLYDPGRWMGEIRRVLKENGHCIFALPNATSADFKWFGPDWAALDAPRHLWHFSPENFKKFAQNYGFSCIRLKPMPLDVFYISILSYRNRGYRFPLPAGILTSLFLSLVNIFNRGKASSLIYVLTKKAL